MPGWGVIPTIRMADMAAALEFYRDRLGFEVLRGDASEQNSAVQRGDARIMLEVPGSFFSDAYNEAIRARLRAVAPTALYIEAEDLDELYARVQSAGVQVIDPLASRPWGQSEFTIEDLAGNWLTFWRADAV